MASPTPVYIIADRIQELGSCFFRFFLGGGGGGSRVRCWKEGLRIGDWGLGFWGRDLGIGRGGDGDGEDGFLWKGKYMYRYIDIGIGIHLSQNRPVISKTTQTPTSQRQRSFILYRVESLQVSKIRNVFFCNEDLVLKKIRTSYGVDSIMCKKKKKKKRARIPLISPTPLPPSISIPHSPIPLSPPQKTHPPSQIPKPYSISPRRSLATSTTAARERGQASTRAPAAERST